MFVARDEELNREVALKEIQNCFADDLDSRSRFVLEAEVTGGLEHPGIVPVYGLGQYEDGRPYYAMRFIKGDSLKEAIDEFHSTSDMSRRELAAGSSTDAAKAESGKPKAGGTAPGYESLAFRKLLGRFIDVCQAISYAHSRGVLHRDLKPGNIMLGKYGETLVVDWGLAKVRDRDDSSRIDDEATLRPSSGSGVTPTMMGSAIGTPAYMPPEQAAGRLEELGPASDVYSLGATLYHLLTGQSPFRGTDPGAVLKDVQAGRFPPPRTFRSDIPKPLEAVCLKAMALKPGDRYSSPQLLADDIEHYLADEPVTAFPEPIAIRARRWMRHHPAIVSTAAACVLLAVAGLSIFSAVVTGKNQQLAEANTKERSARQQAETNEKRAIVGEDLARKNADAATEQSTLALSTMTSVIFDLQRSLSNVAGGAGVRRQLLSTVLPKLEQVSTEFASKSAVDRNTMVALMELGDVVLQLGDVGQASSLSMTSSFQEGVRILQAMIERGMNVEQSRSELAMLESQLQSARMAEVALGDWEMLLLRSVEELPALLDARGIQCSKRSRFEDAAQAATKLCQLDNAENGHLYNAACVFSLCAASIKAAEGGELTAEQTAQRQTWINEAIAALKQSIGKGWTDFAHMQQDSDLTILRDLPEFKALIPVKPQ